MKQPKPTLISTICHDIDDYPGITDLTSWGDVKKIMTKSENAQKFEQHWNGRMYNDLKITFARCHSKRHERKRISGNFCTWLICYAIQLCCSINRGLSRDYRII